MNDKEYRRNIARIKKLAKWKAILGLWAWDMLVEFDRTGESFEDIGITARCFPLWQYQQMTIIWNMPAVVNKTDDELEYALVHEFSHALIDPMSDDKTGEHVNELVATMVAKAILWARDAGKKGRV